MGARPAIELLEGDPRVDALVGVQDLDFSHWRDFGDEVSRNRLRKWFRTESFDLVLDACHAVAGVGAVLSEAPIPPLRNASPELQEEGLRMGLDGAGAVRYAVERGWNIRVEETVPRLHPRRESLEEADEALTRSGFGTGALAAISPSTSSPLKRWPIDRFIETGGYLLAHGFHLLIVAGPGDATLAQSIRDAFSPGRVISFDSPHLLVVAALLSRCRLLLCDDAGLMHLAAARGHHAVALFGPTSPQVYAPAGALSVGGTDTECRRRRVTEFGPPLCVSERRCLREDRPCIEAVETKQVLFVLNELNQKMSRGY